MCHRHLFSNSFECYSTVRMSFILKINAQNLFGLSFLLFSNYCFFVCLTNVETFIFLHLIIVSLKLLFNLEPVDSSINFRYNPQIL